MKTLRYMDAQFFNSDMNDITKITVISDTHGIIDDEITSVLSDSDVIVHAGDIMSTSIIKKLKTYCKRVIAVAGNNDLPERYSAKEDKKIISELKTVEQFSINNELVTVEHGDRFGNHPSHDDLRMAYPDSKLIIYGHTHNQVCDKSTTPWVVNPGAAGHTRNNDGGPCYMQILIDNDDWEIQSHCIK
jgi:putative phosphoesterase